MTDIVLASGSPRRRELLAALVDGFRVAVSDVEEVVDGDPEAEARRLAREKALAVAANEPGAIVIAADTIVHDGARPYGKPRDPADAAAMLRALRGRGHRVLTGLAVVSDGAAREACSIAEVELAPMSDAVIDAYVAGGRPLDKAGAYAIQDEDVPTVARLDGCYCAVMGLGLWRLRALLAEARVAAAAPDGTFERCASCPERTP